MKILTVSDAWKPQVNGVVRTYEHIGAELIKAGHDFRVIGSADFPLRVPMPGYTEIELAIAPYRRLEKLIRVFDPDALHIATEGPLGSAARAFCNRHGLKFTTSYHTHFPDYIAKRIAKFAPPLAAPAKALAIRRLRAFHNDAAAMLIATQSLEDELKDWGFTAPARRLIRGVKLDIFRPGEKTLFIDLPRPVALFVGRVAIEKNLEDFLGMRWHGSRVVVGDGPDLGDLKRRYPQAVFTGKKEGEELAAHYRAADVFVFPSRTDTFGMVLVEALASGLPVAAYNVTGPRDIITLPHLGVLHESDLALAAEKAAALVHLADQRRSHIETHYTWPVAAQQFLDVLVEIGK